MISLRQSILCLLLLLQFAGVLGFYPQADYLQDNRTVDEILQESEEESSEKTLPMLGIAECNSELLPSLTCESLAFALEPAERYFLLSSILSSAP